MSFLKITDPRKREAMIRDYIETRRRIKENLITEKVGKMDTQLGFEKIFKPITETQKTTTKEITEGLKPIKEGIEKLPKTIPSIEPPPPYEVPFADEYEVPGEKKLDEKNIPGYIEKTEDGYNLGNLTINFDEVNENVLYSYGKIFSDSPKIYDILTNKKSGVT